MTKIRLIESKDYLGRPQYYIQEEVLLFDCGYYSDAWVNRNGELPKPEMISLFNKYLSTGIPHPIWGDMYTCPPPYTVLMQGEIGQQNKNFNKLNAY